MTTIKSLLDSAFKASSTNAFWSDTGITVATFTAPWEWEQGTKKYTPPCDGYIMVSSSYASGMQIYSKTSRLYVTTAGASQTVNFHSASLPVRKGDEITFIVFLRSGVTQTSSVIFFPCKGQG